MKLTGLSTFSTMALIINALVHHQGHLTGKGVFDFIDKIPGLVFNFLLGNNSIKIHESYDAEGNLFWQVYDSTTGRSAQFYSEQEVRIWLEERYHH